MGTDNSLATELLHELKAQSKRWFIAFCVMVGLEIATIAGFMWYISLPVSDDTVFQDNDGDDNTMIGIGDNYGTSDSEKNQESDTESQAVK